MQKKLLFLTLLFVFGFILVLPSAVSAQSTWWNPTYGEFVDKVEGVNGQPPANEIFGERYTHAQVSWIINSLVNIIGGPVAKCARGGNAVACLTQALQASSNPGPILALGRYIDFFQTSKPASSVEYIAQKLDRLDIIPEAYAQSIVGGYGFGRTLFPVQTLWAATRNAAYALSSLVIIALAFMIMFRTKISPQTVITIQSALPKIVFALVLITLSYAISGFIIDLGFLLMGLIGALASFSGISSAGAVQIFQQLNRGVESVIAYGIAFILEALLPGTGGIINRLSGGQGTAGVLNPGNLFVYLDVIVALIVFVLLVIALIRIFWLLLRSYTVFVFTVIASPFIILLGTLRPASGGSTAWIKVLVSQVAVFVSVSLLILLGHVMFWSFGNGGVISGAPFANPFMIQALSGIAGNNEYGAFPGGFSFPNTAAIGFFVSLAVMLSIPKIASSIRDYIQSGKATFGFGLGDGETAIGAGAGLAGSGLREYRNRWALVDRDQTGFQTAVESGRGIRYGAAAAGEKIAGMLGGGRRR